MSLNSAVILTVLLIGAMSLAGCTGSPPAPVVTPAPVPVVTMGISTPAPVTTAAPVTAPQGGTTETPAPGHLSSKTYTFGGTGDATQSFTTTDDRTWVFRMSCQAKEIFLVTIRDDRGDDIDVLADASDVWAGTESVWLKAGTYYPDVAADSPWTITLSTS